MIYKSICKDFQPVFHKFFETYFRQPSVWYERRRAYIHSVATTSMCGYVLGIGDRHVSNILIDKQTAEVVHIDFGKLFSYFWMASRFYMVFQEDIHELKYVILFK